MIEIRVTLISPQPVRFWPKDHPDLRLAGKQMAQKRAVVDLWFSGGKAAGSVIRGVTVRESYLHDAPFLTCDCAAISAATRNDPNIGLDIFEWLGRPSDVREALEDRILEAYRKATHD